MRRKGRREGGLTRRSLLWIGAAGGAGLLVGFPLRRLIGDPAPSEAGVPAWQPPGNEPALWIEIGVDELVTVIVPRCEMGQGVTTALPMIVAEELDVEWSSIRTRWASLDPAYGRQLTGASDAVRALWMPLRQAGAAARDMLVTAAAEAWGVARETCRTSHGVVVHEASGRRVTYGQVSAAAARLPVPADYPLASRSGFRIIGQPIPRLDIEEKVTGRAVYGWDIQLPNLQVAAITHSPVSGGSVHKLDDSRARSVPGVRDVVPVGRGGTGPSAVAVVADSYWAAQRGLAAIDVMWDPGPNVGVSSESVTDTFRSLAERTGRVIVQRGEARHALTVASRRIDAIYETPFLAHTPMEPLCCTAQVAGGRCDVWVPTQNPNAARDTAAEVAGLPASAVTVHQTYLGGGFGRRQRTDVVAEAVEIATVVGGPVKLLWSRQEDIQHGTYRPATYNQLSAAIDAGGMPSAWVHRVVGFGGTDDLLVQGIDDVPYAIPNRRIELVRRVRGPVRTGPWRALARSQNAFVTECFFDELSELAGQDPLELRLALLDGAPRFRSVVALAAEKAGWGGRLAEGHGRGVAVTENFGAICAQVAEVSVEGDRLRVHRVVCVLDCGQIVNPDIVVAQMEGGIIFGLSAAMREEITIAGGRVQQSNFHDYPVLRMVDAPAIEVVLIESPEPPGGVGETSVPPIAPAVANAVFAATGQRLRTLPIGRVRPS